MDSLIDKEPVDFLTPEDGASQSAVKFSAEEQKDNFLGGGITKKEAGKSIDITPLYRGVWADRIKDGDQIPVGGSIFSDELDIIMEVDTEWLKDKTVNFTREKLDELYNSDNGQLLKKWVEDNGIKVDPMILHHLLYVQNKMRALLEVGDESVAVARKDLYLSQRRAKLSEFVGQSECAEQAVVGKLLLDKIGIKSTFMEGVHVDSKESDPFDHSFLVLDDLSGEGSLIFDIARPKASVSGYPRILRSEKKLDPTVFEGKNNYVVPAVDIYNGSNIYYGVGHSSLMQDVNFAE